MQGKQPMSSRNLDEINSIGLVSCNVPVSTAFGSQNRANRLQLLEQEKCRKTGPILLFGHAISGEMRPSEPECNLPAKTPARSRKQVGKGPTLTNPPEALSGVPGTPHTLDNPPFPEPSFDALRSSKINEAGRTIAINCKTQFPYNQLGYLTDTDVDDGIRRYVRAGLAESTLKSYAGDFEHFNAWGGHVPASASDVARYLSEHAPVLAVATLERRLAAIAKAHRAAGFASPTKDELVKATFRGIKRVHGTAQRQAMALLRDDLFMVLDAFGDRLKDARDRALLLVGFAGGFRRSELIGLNVEDVEHARQGIIITIRRSKTDQTGQGRRIGIPFGRTRHCPVLALERWLTLSGIDGGPIFRPLTRQGGVRENRLSGEAVSVIIKERVAAAGCDPTAYSGHSLRSGFATSAAQAGASSLKIRAQTGHASDAMLSRYIREGELFSDNAAGQLL